MNTILSATSSEGPMTDVATHTVQVYSHAGLENGCETAHLTYTLEVNEIAPGLVTLPTLACPNCKERLGLELM